MLPRMVVIAKHPEIVARLGLGSLAGARAFSGELVKNHRGRRDIQVVRTTDSDGHELRLYLKRNWKPYKKDGLAALVRHGKPWSIARQEWEHSLRLQAAGLPTAGLVAYGEECGRLWERFSFILTEAAEGAQTLGDFLLECRDRKLRRRVGEALARHLRKMHDAGLATPDLFTRHIFVDARGAVPAFCLIDMARLDVKRRVPLALRARDLAALHLTAPLNAVSWRERMRLLAQYEPEQARELAVLIQRRAGHLLRRRKFRDFAGEAAA